MLSFLLWTATRDEGVVDSLVQECDVDDLLSTTIEELKKIKSSSEQSGDQEMVIQSGVGLLGVVSSKCTSFVVPTPMLQTWLPL